jgi:2-polyprenyl-3-methyl-5-hydroxy-6-metoxy-1,4-benzoquinol methylase
LACPSCGSLGATVVDRKWLVTTLRRCQGCRLLFRAPTTTAEENAQFYQSDYAQGFTTDMPSEADLAALLATGFAGHEKNYQGLIAVLQALGAGPGCRLFDYGCSWGYGSYQLRQAGYQVEAFEISRPRAEYARDKLGVTIRQPAEVEPRAYDVFFSAHVIEHVPSVSEMIDFGLRSLKPGGLFVAFTPNGSAARRARNPVGWHSNWGLVHPQMLDDEYLRHRFRGVPLVATSSEHPLTQIAQWDRSEPPLITDMSGDELMFAVRNVG